MTLKQLTLAFGLAAVATAASAQSYPDRPITLVVPFPPGSVTDVSGRALGQYMSEKLGQPVVIENRPGATGSIGSTHVAKSPPDGYTLSLGNDATHVTNPMLYEGVTYDQIEDFTPIAPLVANVITLVVHPSMPAQNLEEFLAYARSPEGEGLAFATPGIGSPHHLAGEMMNQMADTKLNHVPYKGGGPAVTDLLGGQILVSFSSLAAVKSHVEAGNLRLIGVMSPDRNDAFPDAPSLTEAVPGLEIMSWTGMFGPAGMDDALVDQLNAVAQDALRDPKVVSVLEGAGLIPTPGPADQLAQIVSDDITKRQAIIDTVGIKVE